MTNWNYTRSVLEHPLKNQYSVINGCYVYDYYKASDYSCVVRKIDI